jgi:phage-related protein (TIGR01555 family)
MSILDRALGLFGFSPVAPPPVIEARTDADPAPAAYSASGMVNLVSGIGGARDSGQAARPNVQRLLLSDGELEALGRDTVYRRLCALMPDYATQQGWTVSDGTPLTDPLAKQMRELRVAARLAEADESARTYGRAALWPIVTDEAPSLEEPLNIATVSKVHAVHALTYRELFAVEWETDIRSPDVGKPRLYSITPANTGRTYRVHASRVALFLGDPLLPTDRSNSRLGYPLAFQWWDAIRDMGQISASAARAAQELSVGIFKMPTAATKSTSSDATSFAQRMALLAMGKSVAQAMVLMGDEEYRRESIPGTGFDSFSTTARQMLSLVTGYPEQLLFGTAPGGLNTDGDSWWRNWTNTVNAYQIRRYQDPLRWLCRVLYAEAGGEPEKWELTFDPLGALDSKSRAEIRLLTAQADQIEVTNGVLTPEEVRARYSTGRYEFELQPLDQVTTAEEVSAPADLQAANAALTDLLAGRPLRIDGPLALCLLAPLDAAGRDIFAATLDAVRAIVPALDVEPHPHVTLLYLGEQPDPAQVVNVYDRARAVLDKAAPAILQAGAVQVFDAPAPGEPSPVVIEYRSQALARLAAELLRACAPAVTAPQHDRFRAHVTLGYARLTDEQVAALEAIQAPGRHVVAEVTLTQGGREMVRPMRLGAGR